MIKKIQQRTLIFMLIALSGSSQAQQNKGSSINVSFGGSFLSSLLESNDKIKLAKMLLAKPKSTKKLAVTATAYTSHAGQTDSTPNIAAWGDRLRPGMKTIAVSRDLLNKYHLKRGTLVKIQGLPGKYVVLDKMNKRWKKKIDIYMGKDKRKAFQWGKQKVVIEWAS